MSTAYFDSHKYAKRLMEAGIPLAAADVMAEAMYELACQVAELPARVEEQLRHRDELGNSQRVPNGGVTIEHREIGQPVIGAIIDLKIETMAWNLRGEIARSETKTTRWVGIGFIATIYLIQFILIACIP